MPVETQRERVFFPERSLETPWGKMYYQFTDGYRAHFGTRDKGELPINGIPYRINVWLVQGGTGWALDTRNWRRMYRTDNPYGINRENYTDAAMKFVKEKLVPLFQSYLDLVPDERLEAEKIELNNKIADLQNEEEKVIERLRSNRNEQADLLSNEEALGGPYERREPVEGRHPQDVVEPS